MFVICIVFLEMTNEQRFYISTTIAPEKSGNKNVRLREKYKSTKFPQ